MTFEDALNIYTDGSSYQSPRRGGLGIRFITYDECLNELATDVYFPGYLGATNNQMELRACILAIDEAIKREMLLNVSRIVIFTDSFYIVDNYKRAMFQWSRQKWYKNNGQPVLNATQWKKLVNLIKKCKKNVEFIWVKSHSKNIHNKAVDRMAKQSAKIPIKEPLSVVRVRRKLSSEEVDIGSVEIKGQRISIRIISSEYLEVQRISKYKYEIISKKSEYCGLVDIIYSDLSLRAGHSYCVVFNTEQNNPRIRKVIKELTKS